MSYDVMVSSNKSKIPEVPCMSDEFREKAIKLIVEFGGGNADELKGLDDKALLDKYCSVTGESAEDYKDA